MTFLHVILSTIVLQGIPEVKRTKENVVQGKSRTCVALLFSAQDMKRLHIWAVLAQFPEHHAA